VRAGSIAELRSALDEAKTATGTTVIVVEVDRYEGVPGYDSWWDVAVSEVSEAASVQAAREEYDAARRKERSFL
jgi:3D-(3,5/4)-trihydroxycyclohexane-1,2-dione acylhydrolase (decyclizing)